MFDWVVVFDIDGVFTDGTFWQSKDGKALKRFGADDWDAIEELEKYCNTSFLTADKKGFPIVEARFLSKKKVVNCISNKPKERWEALKFLHPDQKIIFVGDGIYDWYCLDKADYGITTIDALNTTKEYADYISNRTGANRFVADACLHILEKMFKIDIWHLGL